MTCRLSLHPEVWTDVGQIREWYGEISPGLFNDFGRRLADLLDRIGEHPEMYAPAEAAYRRANLSRFPYHVFYVVRADHVWLLGIFHDHAEPEATMRRLVTRMQP